MTTQPDPSRHPHWRAWQMFFEAHAAVCADVEAELQREHGLSLRWYDVLLHLHAVPGRRLSMRDLGDAVVISKSGLTGVVDRMAKAGLVERVPDPGDRRVTLVALTALGAERYERARPDHRTAVAARFLDRVEPAELQVIERAMAGVLGR
ncbi:MAG TPA: MarR family transcriptional regulator [Gaiellales bacterium]